MKSSIAKASPSKTSHAAPAMAAKNTEKKSLSREVLLDATIDSLVEMGYAGTSTRGVSERAGVTQGALQYYYPNKISLVDEAISRIVNQLFEQIGTEIIAGNIACKSERERAILFIDTAWNLHNLDISRAAFELLNTARTDSEIAARVIEYNQQMTDFVQVSSAQLLPNLSKQPGFTNLILLCMTLLRGAVVMEVVPVNGAEFSNWHLVRGHMIEVLDQFIANTENPDVYTSI